MNVSAPHTTLNDQDHLLVLAEVIIITGRPNRQALILPTDTAGQFYIINGYFC
jgi:hypothetical protein